MCVGSFESGRRVEDNSDEFADSRNSEAFTVEEVGAPGDDTREEVDLLRLSNDAYYTEQKKKQGGTAKTRPFDQKARHSAPALKMLSLRLTETMAKHELRCLHRPQGQFIPKKRSAAAAMGLKFGGSYQVNVRLRSLVGYDYTIPQPFAANSTTIEDLWKTAKQLQPRLQYRLWISV